jgi:transmembrane protein EpsG
LIDFFTFFIYSGLLFLLQVLANLSANTNHDKELYLTRNNFKIEYFFSVLLISFIVGFRYDVGNDWAGYVSDFNNIKTNTFLAFEDQYYEFAFFYINKIISGLGLSYHWMFFSISFISWYFLYKSLPNKLIPLFIFFIFITEYFFWSMNGIRQFVALAIWTYSIRFIIKREKYYYFLFLFIASLFHTSAIILTFFYFLKLKYNRKLFLILFFISSFVGTTDYILQIFFKMLTLSADSIPLIGTYLRYFDPTKTLIIADLNYGLGYYFIVIVNFLLLFFSESVIKKYPSSKIYFFIFAIGTVLFNLSTNIFLIGRINTYLMFFKSIALTYTFIYYWNFKQYRFYVFISLLFFLVFFYSTIYNSSNMCSPYQF